MQSLKKLENFRTKSKKISMYKCDIPFFRKYRGAPRLRL